MIYYRFSGIFNKVVDNEKLKGIVSSFIGLVLMLALPSTTYAYIAENSLDIKSLDMSVIDVQIKSHSVMTAEDLYDFLQSDTEKTVNVNARTGKITAVSEGIIKPRIAVKSMCKSGDSCLVHSRVPYADFGFSGTGTKTGDWPYRISWKAGSRTAKAWYRHGYDVVGWGIKFGPHTKVNMNAPVTAVQVTNFS